MNYDKNNIFFHILNGEMPCEKVYEDDDVLAFYDIEPVAKIHVIVIPKGHYMNMDHFCSEAQDQEILSLFRAVPEIAKTLGIEKSGYRLISNCGTDGGQEVPHLHLHMLAGEDIGALRSRK